MLRHLPDKDNVARPVNRKFAYTILATLKPSFAGDVMRHAMNARVNEVSLKIKPENYTVSTEILELLVKYPHKSGKKGRAAKVLTNMPI